MFITYEGDGEVIITNTQSQEEMLREYFKEGGRNLDDYQRQYWADVSAVVVESSVKASG